LGFAGANITVPHKEAVLPTLQHLSPEVHALRAANTLAVREDESGRPVLLGLNTDHAGLIQALREAGVELMGCRALVLGAGGSARAAVYGLMGAGAASIAVLNRSPGRAEALIAKLAAVNHETVLSAGLLAPGPLAAQAAQATLLVNATAAGMAPVVEESPWPDALPLPAHLAVLDLVYKPRCTRLLAQAEAAGARPISGLSMLIHQAAQAFEIWTGERAPIEVMRKACDSDP
jgi:shikimate dehydrogenase